MKDINYYGFIIKIELNEPRNSYSYTIYNEDKPDRPVRGGAGIKTSEEAITKAKDFIDTRLLKEDVKPTFNKPITPMGKNFDKKFNSTMDSHGIDLNEVDGMLNEREFSLKKKIFSLAKMESLVFNDPKLTMIYDDMSQNGEEKYGYHYNETIMNIIFNDYILNSAKFLEKYKMAIPSKKKRRDKSGIDKLKKNAEKQLEKARTKKSKKSVDEGLWDEFLDEPLVGNDDEDTEMSTQVEPSKFEKKIGDFGNKIGSTLGKITRTVGDKFKKQPTELDEETSAASAGGDAGYVGYAGPAAWSSKGDLIKGSKNTGSGNVGGKSTAGVMRKPMWPGGTLVQENYLTESKYYENVINFLNEIDLSLYKTLHDKYDKTHTGSNNGMGVNSVKQPSERQKLIDVNQETHGLKYSEQDLDNIPTIDLKVLKHDSIDKHAMFPHPDNKVLQDDGISGRVDEKQDKRVQLDHKIDNETNAFDSDSVKSWNKQNASLEDETLETGKMDSTSRENEIDEDTNQSMISDNPTSITNDTTQTMANTLDNPEKATSGIERGTAAGAGEMSENELFENIERELDAFSKHQTNLNKMMEERKTNSQIINDRVTSQNPKNFKTDMKDSGTENIIKLDNFLQTKKDIEEVGDNAHKFSEDLEKDEISKTKGESFKNVGNSGNEKGNEIPKRNMTTDEQHEVDMYRKGLNDFVYDLPPSKQFEDRMKTDMGDKLYKDRQDKLKLEKNKNLYNKTDQPVTSKKETEPNKYDKNLAEALITGRYKDSLGKSHIIDFKFKEAKLSESVNENWSQIHFDGMGNSYANKLNHDSSKLEINEAIVNSLNSKKYYINEKKQLFAVENKKSMISESEEKNIIQESDEMKKIKKLLNYKTNTYVDNRFNKRF